MRKMTRVLAIVLTLAMVLSLMPVGVFAANTSGKCGNNLTWVLKNDTLTISGTGDMYDWEYYEVPWPTVYGPIEKVIINEGVTGIGDMAFSYCDKLTSITLPNSLKRIGVYAFFNCTKLTSITLPYGFTSIGREAFCGCTKLTSITIPPTVNSIGDLAFSNSNSKLVIYGYTGTTAETYAKKNSITFRPLDGTFMDVPAGEYYTSAVNWAVAKNITAGLTAATFGPNGPCTRAQVVTFLWRYAGRPAPKTQKSPFTDVTLTASGKKPYYYDAVLWAWENGIVAGTSATTFSPENNCTRVQVVSFLWRAAGTPAPTSAKSAFTDMPDGNQNTARVNWAAENGIVAGTDKGVFSPNATCTRGQIVTFLYRYNNMIGNIVVG